VAAIFIIVASVVVINTLNHSEDATHSDYITASSSSVEDISHSDYITVHHNKQPPAEYVFGESIYLINNAEATDPTWQQLYEFLISDNTDSNFYIPYEYECGHFAQDVHNNAEAVGIKAAWVVIWFIGEDEGHAINAFNTVDYGLIFIDCQGFEFSEIQEYDLYGENFDYIAYIVEGKALGEIHISEVESFDYSFYEEYRREWLLSQWQDIPDEPPQIVETVEIYW